MSSEALAIVAAYREAGATAAIVLADWYAHGPATQGAIACRLGLTRRTVSSAVDALARLGCAVVRGSIVKPASHFVQSASHIVQSASHEKLVSHEKPASHFVQSASHLTGSHADAHGQAPTGDARAEVINHLDEPTERLNSEIPAKPSGHQCEAATAAVAPAKPEELILDLQDARAYAGEVDPEPGPPIKREKKPRRKPRNATAASEILRLWSAEYELRKRVAPTITRGHAARLTQMARDVSPEIAPAVVRAYFADPFATQAGHTLGVLCAAAVWDRVLLAAYADAPHLLPMPDPETATLERMEAHLAAMPEIVRIEVAGYRYDWEAQGKQTTGKILGKMIRAAIARGVDLGWFTVAR